MAIKKFPPEVGTYRYVLRRYNILTPQPQHFGAYDETCQSRWIEVNGKWAHTLFVRKPNTWKRAKCLGWKDETEKWEDHLKSQVPAEEPPAEEPPAEEPPAEEPPAEKVVKPVKPEEALSPDARDVLAAMKKGTRLKAKKEIMKSTGFSAYRVKNAIDMLRELGLANRVGVGIQTRYYSA